MEDKVKFLDENGKFILTFDTKNDLRKQQQKVIEMARQSKTNEEFDDFVAYYNVLKNPLAVKINNIKKT